MMGKRLGYSLLATALYLVVSNIAAYSFCRNFIYKKKRQIPSYKRI